MSVRSHVPRNDMNKPHYVIASVAKQSQSLVSEMALAFVPVIVSFDPVLKETIIDGGHFEDKGEYVTIVISSGPSRIAGP